MYRPVRGQSYYQVSRGNLTQVKRNEYIIILAFVIGLQALRAGIPESYGLGADDIALARAGSEVRTTPESSYFNPASLVSLKPRESKNVRAKNQFGFGFLYQVPSFSINADTSSSLAQSNAKKGTDLNPHGALQFGAIGYLSDIFTTPYNIPVAFGISASLVGAGRDLVKLTDTTQKFYDFKLIGRNVARPSISTGIGVSPWRERLAIGFASHFSADGDAKLRLTKLDATTPENEAEIAIGIAPVFAGGITYRQPFNNSWATSFGFYYRTETKVEADASIEADLPINGLDVTALVDIGLLTFYTPEVFSFGSSVEYSAYELFLSIELQRWSQFELGRTRALQEPDPSYQDVVALRVGGNYELPQFGIELLTGYSYVPSFTPEQVGITNNLDNDKHIFGFGIQKYLNSGRYVKRATIVKFGGQYQVWQMRTSSKKVRSRLSDGTFQPNYTFGGGLFIFSLSITVLI